MASNVKLWELGLIAVATTDKFSYNELNKRLDELNYDFVSEKRRKANEGNALILYSTLLNFGQDYLKLGQVIFEVPGISAEIQYSTNLQSKLFVKASDSGVFIFYFLINFGGVSKSTDEIIQMLGGRSLKFKLNEDLLTAEEVVQRVLNNLRKHSGAITVYFVTYLQKYEDIGPDELYGMTNIDPTYSYAKENLVSKILNNDASMLKNIKLYFGINGAIVMYESDPVNLLPGIINYSITDAGRDIAQYLESAGYMARISDALNISPYIDYMVEIEPLRVEITLLKDYDERIRTGRKSKGDIATLKSELTEQLDFYYSITNTRYSGVSMAMKVAAQVMGVDDLNKMMEERLRLVGESVEINHQLKLEFINVTFTYMLAAFGFASLLMIFLFNYYRWINPTALAISVVILTIAFLILIKVVLKIISRSEKSVEK